MNRGSMLIGLFLMYAGIWIIFMCLGFYVDSTLSMNATEYLFWMDILFTLGIFQQMCFILFLGMLAFMVASLDDEERVLLVRETSN